MGAADSDRRVVVFHQLSEKFRSGQHGKLQLFGTGKFGIIRMYCSGVYDEVDVVCDVFRFLGLAIVDVRAAFFEVLGQGRAVPVGAGYGKALG